MNYWFMWRERGFEHALSLAHVAQWLYHSGIIDGLREHAFVWVGGSDDHLTFEGPQAREFRDAMVKYMMGFEAEKLPWPAERAGE